MSENRNEAVVFPESPAAGMSAAQLEALHFRTREKLRVAIFEHTLKMIDLDPRLAADTAEMIAGTVFRPAGFTAPEHPVRGEGCIEVVRDSTFHCASRFAKDKRTAVLNFANAYTPGGGVRHGSRAQEECLCRSSILYRALNRKEMKAVYYGPNKAHRDAAGSHAVIWSPGVTVCKNDAPMPQPMPREAWFRVGVLTCAAPFLKYQNLPEEEVLELHLVRGRNILETAVAGDTEVLVLGAFGCGAFKNPPEIVAEAYRRLLVDEGYGRYFEKVVFAIMKSHSDLGNYEAFRAVLAPDSAPEPEEQETPRPDAGNPSPGAGMGAAEIAALGYREKDRIRADIFSHTLEMIRSDARLAADTTEMIAGTVCYPAGFRAPARPVRGDGCIEVVRDSTFRCASRFAKEKRTAVLNFANAYKPGGGVRNGRGAQEECLCRSSILYRALDTKQMKAAYYAPNKENTDARGSDAVIWSPGVTVCKDDTILPQPLAPEDRFRVGVLTCAAPYLAYVTLSDEEILQLHLARGRNILEAAIANGTEVLVLGAFGCGVFKNPPAVVAEAYRRLLKDEGYAKYFEKVLFAILSASTDSGNFEAFRDVMARETVEVNPSPADGQAVRAGDTIVHPQYGRGEITEVTDTKITAVFPDAGRKNLGRAWCLERCRIIGGESEAE